LKDGSTTTADHDHDDVSSQEQETKDDVDQLREENGAVTTEIPRSRKIK